MKTRHLSPFWMIFLLACNTAPKNQPVKTDTPAKALVKIDTGISTITRAVARPSDHLRDISGYYKQVNDDGTNELNEGCGISVNITKDARGFNYHLKTSDTLYRGKVTLRKSPDWGYGIVFEGIEYAEYEGDVSKDEESSEGKELDLPVGVDGVLQQDTITIQNYGNAMNYYVKLSGCAGKYIRLVKTK